MEPIDPEAPLSKPKPEILQTLLSGRFSSAAAALSARSRSLPTGKDFHFFHNFPDFKLPIKSITSAADSSLRSLSSAALWASKPPPPLPSDLDDALEWLFDLNDELLERVGVSLDQFRTLREKEEEGEKERRVEMEEGGFQLVFGKKKKKSEGGEENSGGLGDGGLEVKVALKDKKTMGGKPKVPFHIPTILRPQDEFNILVNNKNQPFQHVWLETSEDGSRFVHPLEKLSVVDFVDRNVEGEPVRPLPLECTPFKFVEGVKELKELASKLRDANEFAVDLEHNHYRSFQGLTCLMQISTRTEDFIIDTLKLRVHIGPYLREAFKDPSKRKVMHGSDRDIVWLQRDFGIYVCNLFDTGQASRILQLERNSLEHLLHHFCGVKANKEYQNADWRLRPLPDEMVKYAREDTHYLLYIYDVMKLALLSTSSDENDLLLEVYKRSYDICMHLYEKELLTDSSYLYIYGLQEADFSPSQLAIVAGLCAWRDKVARDEDESTGYILPNKALLEIARQMPTASGKLRRMVKSKHPFVERHLNAVINIIRHAIENSSAFESVAEQLKKGRLEANTEADYKSEGVDATEDPVDFMAQSDVLDIASNSIMEKFEHSTVSMDATDDPVKASNAENCSGPVTSVSKCQQVEKLQTIGRSDMAGTSEKETMGIATECSTSSRKVSTASVQMSVKHTSAFGAFLGGSSRRKLNPSGQGKNETKVEEIRSLVTLPFHSFSGLENPSEPCFTGSPECSRPETLQQCRDQAAAPILEEIIPLESDERDSSPSSTESPMVEDGPVGGRGSQPESKTLEDHNSLSDLSSSFQQCFQSVNERGGRSRHTQRQAKEPDIKIQVKPFDYASARKNIKFGELGETKEEDADQEKVNKAYADTKATNCGGSMTGRTNGGERGEFGRPRRSQAFPPTGNRSTMYH